MMQNDANDANDKNDKNDANNFAVAYSQCFSLEKYLAEAAQVTCFGILKNLVCISSNTGNNLGAPHY